MRDTLNNFDPVESVFYDLLSRELPLASNEDIWIESQNKEIPNDADKLFCIVGFVDSSVISSRNRAEDIDGTFTEIRELVQLENIQIDLLSRDNKARNARGQVIMALSSIFSQQLQELYGFRIFPHSLSFVNTSSVEGGSEINRFTATIPCHVWYTEQKTADYYDAFSTRVDDENSIGTDEGIIEFDIIAQPLAPSQGVFLVSEDDIFLVDESDNFLFAAPSQESFLVSEDDIFLVDESDNFLFADVT